MGVKNRGEKENGLYRASHQQIIILHLNTIFMQWMEAFDEPERKSLKIMYTRAVNFEVRPNILQSSTSESVRDTKNTIYLTLCMLNLCYQTTPTP